jgi:hypothetical protein
VRLANNGLSTGGRMILHGISEASP